MTFPLLYLLLVAASYRTWRLVFKDDFPPIAAPRDRFEDWVNRRFGSEWGAGISCPWCSGWWVTCLITGATWLVHPLPLPALWFPAVATGAGLLAELVAVADKYNDAAPPPSRSVAPGGKQDG